MWTTATGVGTVAKEVMVGLHGLNGNIGLHWVQAFTEWIASVEGKNQLLYKALAEAGELMLDDVNFFVPIAGHEQVGATRVGGDQSFLDPSLIPTNWSRTIRWTSWSNKSQGWLHNWVCNLYSLTGLGPVLPQ